MVLVIVLRLVVAFEAKTILDLEVDGTVVTGDCPVSWLKGGVTKGSYTGRFGWVISARRCILFCW